MLEDCVYRLRMLQLPAFCTLLLLVVVVMVTATHDGEIVRIAEGHVQGSKMISFRGREFRAFRGIPYAEPPTGTLRFKPPQPKSPWSGILNATVEGSICPQMNRAEVYVGDEDCLFLNVYAHKNARRNPVIVWVHGGSFYAGHGGINITAPQFLLDQDITLVTFNYRLGPLGFLSTGDSALPGNYGLKDAVEVLRWIQRNIESFGGNRDLVTVYGYSSGGAMAQSLTMSPLTKGLFHRVIFESGSALHHWAFKSSPIQEARQVAKLIGCPSSDSSSGVAECVASASAKELVETLYSFPYWAVKFPTPYGLVVEVQDDDSDPPFLTEPPLQLLRKGHALKIPAITGNTAAESIFLAAMINKSDELRKELDEHFDRTVLKSFIPGNISEEFVREVKQFYFHRGSAKEATLEQLIQLISDITINYNSYQSSVEFAAATEVSVYMYLFSFQGRVSSIVTGNINPTPLGVAHGDDLLYIFGTGLDFPGGGPNSEEAKTIMRVTKMLADFALKGDPTPKSNNLIPVKWLPLLEGGKPYRYLEINDELTMQSGPIYPERMAFWDNLLAKRRRGEL
ncbi:juvenile hormone esterase [Anabrus simplex]|uniref:juvenile hormone esterase n=1 Tax=Anabrus simplex TaxID=316456 RepID=UPI0035A2AA93